MSEVQSVVYSCPSVRLARGKTITLRRTVGPSSNGVGIGANSSSPSYASFSFPKLNGSPTRPFAGGGQSSFFGSVTPVDTVLDRYGRTGPAPIHGGSSAFMFNPMAQGRLRFENLASLFVFQFPFPLKLFRAVKEVRPYRDGVNLWGKGLVPVLFGNLHPRDERRRKGRECRFQNKTHKL